MATLLRRHEVESVLTMGETIDAVEQAFREYAAGSVQMPLRISVQIPSRSGFHGVMQAYVGGDIDALAVKTGSSFPENPQKYGIPRATLYIMLFNPEDGLLLSVMDGGFITAMRTGAVSGVATKYLARADADVLALFGAGVQGRTQVLGIHEVRPLRRVKVFDVAPGKAAQFSQEMTARLGIEVTAVEEPRAALAGCDIVCIAATAKAPVFEGRWLEEGTHVNSIGSHGPNIQELDSDAVVRARVIVDSRDAVLAECGDLIIPMREGLISADHISGELADLITGSKDGRANEREVTLFKSVGLALQDAAAAARVYELAKQKGIGTEVEL